MNRVAGRWACIVQGLRRWFAPTLLLAGFCFAALALLHMWGQRTVTLHVGAGTGFFSALLALTCVLLSALSWRAFLRGVTAHRIGVMESIGQVGLVLVGKYVPGKIVGIAARIAANVPPCSARSVTAATVIEQLGGLVAATGVGAIAWFADRALLAVPAGLAGAALWLWSAPFMVRWLPSGWRGIDASTGLEAASIRRGLAYQLLLWFALTALVVLLARTVATGAELRPLLQVAGAYGLAVVAGQLMVIFPGGIGPREGAFVLMASGSLGTPDALAVALILRIATTGIDLLAGLGYVVARIVAPSTRRAGDAPR